MANKPNDVPSGDNIPGLKNKGKGEQYTTQAKYAKMVQDFAPIFSQALTGSQAQAIPQIAQAQLTGAQQVSPGYNELMAQLYQKYGPLLNQIGNQILAQNTQAQADLAGGAGQQLLQQAISGQKQADQPWFTARDQAGTSLGNLLNSIDLSGALSPTERDEIQKGLARNNLQAGTYNTPSQTNTVANAMQYGNAAYARKQQAISNLSAALGQASNFLNSSKSGINAFDISSGKNNATNPGAQYFTGITQPSTNTGIDQNQFYQGITGQSAAQHAQAVQLSSQAPTFMDKLSQGLSIGQQVANLGGSVAGMI